MNSTGGQMEGLSVPKPLPRQNSNQINDRRDMVGLPPLSVRAARRSGQKAAPPMQRLQQLAGQNWSCNPRRTCSQIGSCAEARWYLQNCPWGGKLDRDNDGIPCESIC